MLAYKGKFADVEKPEKPLIYRHLPQLPVAASRIPHERPRWSVFKTLRPGLRAVLVALTLAIIGSCSDPARAALRSFKLSQTALLEETPAAVRAYARALDESNDPVFQLDGVGITATLGEAELISRSLESFQQSAEGVAYIFLVDVSRSLSVNEFGLIQASLESWIASLRDDDRAAILTFGDESRLLVDFTNNVAELRESLAALGPTDDSTVFFEALQDGFELAKRRDPGLPGRRALIVLTDGRDEGSGWSLEDILGKLRDEPTPIYSIGLSRIRNQTERERYLQLLRRLSVNSGGAFFEGSTDNLMALYAAIREAIHNVWVMDFVCPDCVRDGETYRLQVNLSDGERVLSDGQRVSLLPPAAGASVTQRPQPTFEGPAIRAEPNANADEGPEPAPTSAPAAGDSIEQSAENSETGWLWLLVPVIAAGAASWLVWNRKKPLTIPPDLDLEALPIGEGIESETYKTPSGIVTTRPPRPVKLRVVRLIVVRGRRPGHTYSLTLLERAVVGSRSTCDCVLVDEPGIAAEQFEFYQMDGHVFIENLSERNPTLVDGLPTEHQHRIQSEALVGTREFIVRVIFGEGRATATG